ncbi:MAG: hypothetical protein PHY59_06490 [Methanobacterium sp.]|nr:hypothetical protein [Methanobacterium sp.]
MSYNNEKKYSFTMDLRGINGEVGAVVCVVPSKDTGKRDILLMDVFEGNFSLRSITELLNLLMKKKVSLDERRRVLDFIAESLLILEKNML